MGARRGAIEGNGRSVLAWLVPNDFAPDAGISFVPPKPGSYGTHWWPIGKT